MLSGTQRQQVARDLRRRIGGTRRRIDRRIRSVHREGRRLLWWRTYVERYPVFSLTAAVGLGLLAALGFRRARWGRFLAVSLLRRSLGGIIRSLAAELRRTWGASKQGSSSTETTGGADG